MSAHLSTEIAIAEIARVCRLSPSHFVRAFGNTVGIAPYRWYLSERIARAKRLLRQSRLPLAQIALECGFADQSHFTNTFVRHVGIAPGLWRRSPDARSSSNAETVTEATVIFSGHSERAAS